MYLIYVVEVLMTVVGAFAVRFQLLQLPLPQLLQQPLQPLHLPPQQLHQLDVLMWMVPVGLHLEELEPVLMSEQEI